MFNNDLWETISQQFHLKLREEFKIAQCGEETLFRFNARGVEQYDTDSKSWKDASDDIEVAVLRGKYTVLPFAFHPEYGDQYFYLGFMPYSPSIHSEKMENSMVDLERVYAGNCFRTEKEAEYHTHDYVKKLKTATGYKD